YHWLTVVEDIADDVEDDSNLIILEQARTLKSPEGQVLFPEAQPGDQIYEDVTPPQFGRIAAQTAKQVVMQKLRDAERRLVFNQFAEREAGFRSKVAVSARQEGIDPVGSCVGVRGVRIQNIVNELNGEKIDVVEWNEDPAQYVANALSPAQVSHVTIDETTRTAKVIVPERQLS